MFYKNVTRRTNVLSENVTPVNSFSEKMLHSEQMFGLVVECSGGFVVQTLPERSFFMPVRMKFFSLQADCGVMRTFEDYPSQYHLRQ